MANRSKKARGWCDRDEVAVGRREVLVEKGHVKQDGNEWPLMNGALYPRTAAR